MKKLPKIINEKCKHLLSDFISQPIDYDKEKKSFSINGCCGGGCYIITNIKYCPFCGEKLI